MYEKGQKLKVVDVSGLYQPPVKVGDVVTVKSTEPGNGGTIIRVEEVPGGGFYPRRFELVKEEAAPRFKKGQKLRVLKGHGGAFFNSGEYVEAQEDSRPDGYGTEYVKVLTANAGLQSIRAARFEPATAPADPFAPRFKKGQRLLVVDGTGDSIKHGEIVQASVDSYLNHLGHELVRLEGHPSYKTFYAKRFELFPEAPKGFKQGQKLVVIDATKANGLLKEGETVTAAADAFIGNEGREIVFVRADKTGMAGTFSTARFAGTLPAVPQHEETVYFTLDNGFFYDLNEANDGDEVAIYKLVKSGKLQQNSSIG